MSFNVSAASLAPLSPSMKRIVLKSRSHCTYVGGIASRTRRHSRSKRPASSPFRNRTNFLRKSSSGSDSVALVVLLEDVDGVNTESHDSKTRPNFPEGSYSRRFRYETTLFRTQELSTASSFDFEQPGRVLPVFVIVKKCTSIAVTWCTSTCTPLRLHPWTIDAQTSCPQCIWGTLIPDFSNFMYVSMRVFCGFSRKRGSVFCG